MNKKFIYVMALSLLALSAVSCQCKRWDWVCLDCYEAKDGSIVEKQVQTVVVKQAVVPVVEKIAKPVVVVEPKMKIVERIVPEAQTSGKYNFGNHRSSTLTTKAWDALAQNDFDGVMVYTDKCLELYKEDARQMQNGLDALPEGEAKDIFAYWAVNDVATSLFIRGEAYRKAGKTKEAKQAFESIVNDYSYGQAYDVPSKTFWKVAEAAEDSLYMIEKNIDLDYGNMTSQYLVRQMWKSLSKPSLDEVVGYYRKLDRLYSKKATEMMAPLENYPEQPAQNIHKYWALNDVGTGQFVLGEAYRDAGKTEQAIAAYKKVTDNYLYAQCWDPQGWFWKPADSAQQKIIEIDAMGY